MGDHEMCSNWEQEHALKPCPDCGTGIPGSKLREHQEGLCPKKSILCKFCATHIEQGNREEHENYCGSRTDKCEECGEFIMLKNFELHINSNHGFIKLKDEPGPKASWEKSSSSHQSTGSVAARKNSLTSSYSSSYTSRYSSKYLDPEPSTPQQRSNFTATELFNNQDLYSSRRYSTTASQSAVSSTADKSYAVAEKSYSTASTLAKSTSSSIVSSSLARSSTSSIVNRSLNEMNGGLVGSKSTSVVSSLMKKDEDSAEVEKLPCEFCEAMVPMYKLLSHQAECVNPSNVRLENGSSSNSSYRAYSSLRSNHNDSLSTAASRRDSSTARERSITRSASMASNSLVSKHLENGDSHKSNGYSATYDRKTNGESHQNGHDTTDSAAKKSNGIVDKYSSYSNGYSDSSSTKRDNYYDTSISKSTSSYMGRSSFLRSEKERSTSNGYESSSKIKKSASTAVVAGMYENDEDREGLRQMLSGLRRDPMEVEDDPDNNDGSFFPCEFCGDPYPCEFLMRHQMSCDLNPQPVASGNGFDYNSIKNSIARTLGPTVAQQQQQQQQEQEQQRSSYRLSRSNSTVDRTYSRSTRSNSISRTSSFADRSYGTRTNLARKASFTVADYSSAVRRSSVFDGYAGYSIYSSISEGLDQITYGGRSSRRNSVTEMTYSFSRRGSVSGDYPLPALMAALDASKAAQEERRERPSTVRDANAHVNGQASAYLNSIHSFSRQNSSNTDSPRGIDSPFGAVNGHHNPIDLQRSDSKARRLAAIKPSQSNHRLEPSQSGHRLERRVSFHNHEQIINQDTVDENGVPIPKPDKPKRKKERTEEEKQARRERKERKERKRQERGESKDRRSKSERRESKNKQHPEGDDLLAQVSAKLQNIEKEQGREVLSPVPPTSLLPSQASSNHASTHLSSSTIKSTTTSTITTSNNNLSANNIKPAGPSGPAYNNLNSGQNGLDKRSNTLFDNHNDAVADKSTCTATTTLVNHENESVTLREGGEGSKMSSKRNSLDNKSVQSLAKDLAAECAKAYELMESSLSKLTNDFTIGPFGLTPKNKKKHRAPQPPQLK